MHDIRSFQDLEVWKAARGIRKKWYVLAERLPPKERYNLAGQIRRAAVSLTANIAEGYGRFHFAENTHCCRVARGSAYELLDHLVTSKDEGYIDECDFEALQQELVSFFKLLNAYINSIGRQSKAQIKAFPD